MKWVQVHCDQLKWVGEGDLYVDDDVRFELEVSDQLYLVVYLQTLL